MMFLPLEIKVAAVERMNNTLWPKNKEEMRQYVYRAYIAGYLKAQEGVEEMRRRDEAVLDQGVDYEGDFLGSYSN